MSGPPSSPPPPPPLPLSGYDDNRHAAGHVEDLDDDSLAELNRMLPWRSFTVDSQGRRFGDRLRPGRRDAPQPVPDPRTLLMDRYFGLRDKHVLEVGCFEGIHTLGLCELAAEVTAVDGHLENVVKTIVRTAFYGHQPTVFLWDVERMDDLDLEVDVVHHFGVLYHLRNPVEHLRQLGRIARVGVFIDTAVATDDEADEETVVDGVSYRYKRYNESYGREQVLAGLYDHGKWLRTGDIAEVLRQGGFGQVRVLEPVLERGKHRAIIVACRTPNAAWEDIAPVTTPRISWEAQPTPPSH